MPEGIIQRIGTISLSVFLTLLIVGSLQLYSANQASVWEEGDEVTWETCDGNVNSEIEGYCDELTQGITSAQKVIYASFIPLIIFIISTVIAHKKKKDETHDDDAQGKIQQIEL